MGCRAPHRMGQARAQELSRAPAKNPLVARKQRALSVGFLPVCYRPCGQYQPPPWLRSICLAWRSRAWAMPLMRSAKKVFRAFKTGFPSGSFGTEHAVGAPGRCGQLISPGSAPGPDARCGLARH